MPFRDAAHHACPRCGDVALNETTSFGVARQRCAGCYGEWLEWTEVLRQFEAHGLSGRSRVFESRDSTDGLRCPHRACNRVMKQLLIAGEVELDFCTSHGFWFDVGELSHSLASADEDAELDPPTKEPEPLPSRVLRALLVQPAQPTESILRCEICDIGAGRKCGMCATILCTKHLAGDLCSPCNVNEIFKNDRPSVVRHSRALGRRYHKVMAWRGKVAHRGTLAGALSGVGVGIAGAVAIGVGFTTGAGVFVAATGLLGTIIGIGFSDRKPR